MGKVAGLLRTALADQGISKSEAARQLGVSRMTLDHWLGGIYNPELEYARVIADFTRESEAHILALMLDDRGIDTTLFSELANYVKGDYRSSVLVTAA